MTKRYTYTRVHTQPEKSYLSYRNTGRDQAESQSVLKGAEDRPAGQPGASALKLASGDGFRCDLWSGDREALSQSLHLSISALNCKIGTITPVL